MPAKLPKSQRRLPASVRIRGKAIRVLNGWRQGDEKFCTCVSRVLEDLTQGVVPELIVNMVRLTTERKIQAYRLGGNEFMAAAARATGEEIIAKLQGQQ